MRNPKPVERQEVIDGIPCTISEFEEDGKEYRTVMIHAVRKVHAPGHWLRVYKQLKFKFHAVHTEWSDPPEVEN